MEGKHNTKRACYYHTEGCENEATIYCHERRACFCESCARGEFPHCAGDKCEALDIEGDFEQTCNGDYLCPACMQDADRWERTKDFLGYCLRNNIV